MTVPFAAQLRTTRPPIQLAEAGAGSITLRVEASDLWETVRVIARPDTPVSWTGRFCYLHTGGVGRCGSGARFVVWGLKRRPQTARLTP